MDRPMERRTHPHIETRERISKCRRTINNISKHNISSFSLLVSLFDLLLLQNFDSRQVSPAETDNIYRQKGQKRQQRQKGQKRDNRETKETNILTLKFSPDPKCHFCLTRNASMRFFLIQPGRPTDRPARSTIDKIVTQNIDKIDGKRGILQGKITSRH